jgi:hypothetical protein
MAIYGTELPIPCPAGETAKRSGSKRLSTCLKYRVALATRRERSFRSLSTLSSVVCHCQLANSPVYINNVANPQRHDKRTSSGSFSQFMKVASNDAHMETPESQAQDTLIMNGAAEASTSSPPASPPPAVLPALSDLSTTAEQGKDGRRFIVTSSCFRSLMSELFCSKHNCCQ